MAQQDLVGAEVMCVPLEVMSTKLQPHETEAALTSSLGGKGAQSYSIVGYATYDAATNMVTFEFETDDGPYKFMKGKASITGSGSSGPFQGTLFYEDISTGAQLFTFNADTDNLTIDFIKSGGYDKHIAAEPVIGLVGNGRGQGTWE